MGLPPAKHGTPSKYNTGCRCDECRAANAAYNRERRARLKAEGFVRQEHGSYTTYADGCRCEACQAAFREWSATRRPARGSR